MAKSSMFVHEVTKIKVTNDHTNGWSDITMIGKDGYPCLTLTVFSPGGNPPVVTMEEKREIEPVAAGVVELA